MKNDANQAKHNPIQATFEDVTILKLLGSTWTVFHRIQSLQGLKAALKVFPIVWTIIQAVKGFSEYHADEYERMSEERSSGRDIEEAVLSGTEYEKYKELGRWLCRQLHTLGPTFIKIGQTLSTRADLLPLPAMLELSHLQEEVDAFPTEIAKATIQRELGKPLSELYAAFNEVPLAAASLSQAYLARLKDGRQVVVKVQRPNLPQILAHDVQILSAVADEVMKYPSLCRHTDWPGVVREFTRTVFEEIDYIREGRNADRFRHNFRNFDDVYIPRIIWRLTGRRVLTIEYVPGAKVTDVATLDSLGIEREHITKAGAKFYLSQLLEDGFFHADPHPGNIRIMADGRIGIFDFGMVGRISPEMKQHMINTLLHTIQKNYPALIDDFINLGFVSETVDRQALLDDITPVIEARFKEGMTKVKFRKMLFDFSDVVFRHPFKLPTEFTFVMRALLTLEGVALTIDPGFNFLETAVPFAQNLVLKNNGAIRQALLKEVFADGRFNPHKAIEIFKAAASLKSATTDSRMPF